MRSDYRIYIYNILSKNKRESKSSSKFTFIHLVLTIIQGGSIYDSLDLRLLVSHFISRFVVLSLLVAARCARRCYSLEQVRLLMSVILH